MRPNRNSLRKKYLIIGIGVLIVFWLISSKYNSYEIDAVIEGDPEKVWHFVSDFSKMKLLNPTILDFTITADKGNPKHWQYSVEYVERLSHWPYLLNRIQGDINVIKRSDQLFEIESYHKTCFFMGLFCLKSKGLFEFSHYHLAQHQTLLKETVHYQCPPFMGKFCFREVEFQRKAIVANLKKHFHEQSAKVL